jgi:nicotinate dehydrogenase subunit A
VVSHLEVAERCLTLRLGENHGQHWNPSQASKLARGLGMNTISIKVNGQSHALQVDPDTPLLFVLGDELGLRGPKFGCGMAQCGACSVIVGGRVMRSCVVPVSAVGKDEVTTLEGLGTPDKPHPIQEAFISEGAAQCGFCLSGVILTAKAALDEKPEATDQEISEALGGVLCRCFAHIRMLRAIRKYAAARKP